MRWYAVCVALRCKALIFVECGRVVWVGIVEVRHGVSGWHFERLWWVWETRSNFVDERR